MEQKINMSINEGDSFYAHESSININPVQIIFDFKNVTPRIDARTQDSNVIVLKHNVIMLDPWHAKQFEEMLKEVIGRYEKEFGKIEKPKAMEKFEKKNKQTAKKKESSDSYFG